MFLIKRKSDGLYYRNLGYHMEWRRRSKILKENDLGDLNPYLQKIPSNINTLIYWTENLSECKPYKTIGGAKTSIGCVKRFDEFYEIVPCEIKITTR